MGLASSKCFDSAKKRSIESTSFSDSDPELIGIILLGDGGQKVGDPKHARFIAIQQTCSHLEADFWTDLDLVTRVPYVEKVSKLRVSHAKSMPTTALFDVTEIVSNDARKSISMIDGFDTRDI